MAYIKYEPLSLARVMRVVKQASYCNTAVSRLGPFEKITQSQICFANREIVSSPSVPFPYVPQNLGVILEFRIMVWYTYNCC